MSKKKNDAPKATVVRVPKWAKVLCAGNRAHMKMMGEAEAEYKKNGRLILGLKNKEVTVGD